MIKGPKSNQAATMEASRHGFAHTVGGKGRLATLAFAKWGMVMLGINLGVKNVGANHKMPK